MHDWSARRIVFAHVPAESFESFPRDLRPPPSRDPETHTTETYRSRSGERVSSWPGDFFRRPPPQPIHRSPTVSKLFPNTISRRTNRDPGDVVGPGVDRTRIAHPPSPPVARRGPGHSRDSGSGDALPVIRRNHQSTGGTTRSRSSCETFTYV